MFLISEQRGYKGRKVETFPCGTAGKRQYKAREAGSCPKESNKRVKQTIDLDLSITGQQDWARWAGGEDTVGVPSISEGCVEVLHQSKQGWTDGRQARNQTAAGYCAV